MGNHDELDPEGPWPTDDKIDELEPEHEAEAVDPTLPRNWSSSKKVLTVALVSILNLLTNTSATIISPAVTTIMREFDVTTRAIGTFAVSVYILGLAVGPMFFAPLSEIYGRLPLYNWTNVGFVYFTALAAIAPQLPVLMVLRFFQGCCGSVPVVVGGGTVADLYAPEVRGRVMSVYLISSMIGPPAGPIIGGFVTQYIDWRWNFGFTSVFGLMLTVTCLVFLRETHEKTILQHREMDRDDPKRGRKCGMGSGFKFRGDNKTLKASLVRPLKLLAHNRTLLILGTYQAFSYGSIVLVLTTFSSVFAGQYGFSTSESGLPLVGIAVGFVSGVFVSSYLSDVIATRLTARNGGVRKASFRLPLTVATCWLLPASLALYGWTAFYKVHFMVPIVAATLAALGLQLVMINVQIFLSEAHPDCVPSAIAAVTALRCVLGSFLPLVGEFLYQSFGLGWGNTAVALVGAAIMPLPWIAMKYGERMDKGREID